MEGQTLRYLLTFSICCYFPAIRCFQLELLFLSFTFLSKPVESDGGADGLTPLWTGHTVCYVCIWLEFSLIINFN